ncbi:MAG: pyridine nucleotide-disulfide oxidoreductase [Porticoccaceae bacterium]|nr:MAG: pyridine nucleotide-disulfide oxidoreductase [Porticoccaceae bacterium]
MSKPVPIKKITLLLVIALIVGAYIIFDGKQYLSLEFFQNLYQQEPELTAAAYFIIYVIAAGLSLPGAALLTIIGGMIFGLLTGFLLVSFASTLGATLAFLVSRFLLRDWVQSKFSGYLGAINQGMEKDGAFYLFTLRLIPVVPFWVINLVMGVTPMKVLTFYLVSQVGMLAGTAVYVNAGAELGAVEEFSAAGILTPTLLLSFILLAMFPFIVRAVLNVLQRRKVYKPYVKPKSFDTNMVVIGAGSAGLVSSYIAAAVKAKVTLVEKNKMGGDCLNTGCVPSKALIRAARTVKEISQAQQLGIHVGELKIDFSAVMGRVRAVIREIEPHDSVERYSALGVDCIQGEATIVSPWEVKVDGKSIYTRNIVIASGARPFVPLIPGVDQMDYLTSDNLWELNVLPKRLLVLGGGAIGCELAQAFNRLGSEVTLVDMMPRVLPREDEDVSAFVQQRFVDEGIKVLVSHKTVGFELRDDEKVALLEAGDENTGAGNTVVAFDQVLVAVGRKANTDQLGLEGLGIELNLNGTVKVDEFLRTRYPNIYACGDVAGPYQFTHTASHQAWYVAVNALFGRFKKFKVDYSVIPWATFTDPEVAHVGLSENDAVAKGLPYEITKYDMGDLDRAIADNRADGFVKVLTVPGKDKILGATIVGYHAGDLLTEFVTAMKQGLGLKKILGTIHSYPTISEANKFVAGNWSKNHAPQGLLRWIEKYHAWQRH